MQSTAKGKRLPIGDVESVQKMADLKVEIDALKAEYPEVFMKYADLVDRYNTALEEAEKEVRAKAVSCGDFDNYSTSVKFDPVKMFEELGEDMFLASGGTMSNKTVYEVDPKKVEAAIANGTVPEECVDNFRDVRRNYRKPSKLSA